MKEINLIGLSGQLQNGKDTVADLILKLTTEKRYHTHYSEDEGKYIQDNFPFYSETEWQTRRFAGVLKKATALIIGCDVSDLEKDSFKNTPLGEEWRRFYIYCDPLLDNHNQGGRIGMYYTSKIEAENNVPIYLKGKVDIIDEILTPRLILQLLGTEGGRDVIHPNIWVNATLGNLKPTDKVIVTDVRFPNEVSGIKNKGGIVIRVVRPSKISTSTHPSETSLNDYNQWDYVIVNDGTLEQLEYKTIEMLKHFGILHVEETISQQ